MVAPDSYPLTPDRILRSSRVRQSDARCTPRRFTLRPQAVLDTSSMPDWQPIVNTYLARFPTVTSADVDRTAGASVAVPAADRGNATPSGVRASRRSASATHAAARATRSAATTTELQAASFGPGQPGASKNRARYPT